MPLDPEQIQALLKKELKKAVGGDISALPRPMQLGPISWHDVTERCTSRGCGSPTLVKVRGVPYCTTHALNKLNEIILRELEHMNLDDCSCKAGGYSKGNIHTYDCALYTLKSATVEGQLL